MCVCAQEPAAPKEVPKGGVDQESVKVRPTQDGAHRRKAAREQREHKSRAIVECLGPRGRGR